MRRKALAVAGSLLLTLLLVPWLLQQTDRSVLIGTAAQLDLRWTSVALVVFTATYLLRALRFRVLLATAPESLGPLTRIVCLHNALISITPVRLGEFSFLYFAQRRLQIPVPRSSASLLCARYFDLLGVVLCVLCLVPFAPERGSLAEYRWEAVALLLVGLVVAWWVLKSGVRTLEAAVARRARPLPFRLRQFLARFREGLEVTGSTRTAAHLLVLSVGVWGGVFLIYYVLLRSIGLDPDPVQATLAAALFCLLSSLPVQGLLGFGTVEAAWTLAFATVGGLERSVAVASGFVVHITVLIAVVGYGAVVALADLAGWTRTLPAAGVAAVKTE